MMSAASLQHRKMVHSVEALSNTGDTLSVLQYNILADAAIPRGSSGVNICGAYEYCPEEHRFMDSKLSFNIIHELWHELLFDWLKVKISDVCNSATCLLIRFLNSIVFSQNRKLLKRSAYFAIMFIKYSQVATFGSWRK